MRGKSLLLTKIQFQQIVAMKGLRLPKNVHKSAHRHELNFSCYLGVRCHRQFVSKMEQHEPEGHCWFHLRNVI